MRSGWSSGERGFALFVDEEGYTSVATAVALLVSVSLVFCLASAEWTLTRSADVQEIADAAALAGSNTVAAFCTIAQVVDACVLSLGLVGMAVLGAGLVMAAIPGVQQASGTVLDAGRNVLSTRQRFAESAVSGLQKVERMLPTLVVLRSAACVAANVQGEVRHTGVALPFPMESHSDYSSLASPVSGDEVEDAARRLQDETERSEEAKERADEARYRGWRADCVDDPSCLCSRAASLADMGGAQNPSAATPESWNFGMPISRSRTYYARRRAREAPTAQDIESVTDSLARAAFYEYALGEVNAAWYTEHHDGSVDLYLPHLARTADEVRGCWLYTDPSWPCTDEEQGRTLHSTLSCTGATGPFSGYDSVASIEWGSTHLCDVCRMDVRDLGSVASISTIAKNGYEHYWQLIVEAAQDYRKARNDQAEAERRMRDIAEEGKGVFERVLDQLRVPRPTICPPGAWGCLAVVRRGSGTLVPSELTSAFLAGAELPAGMAVSASVLAPDEATADNNVLARFFDGLLREERLSVGGVLGGITTLWGSLLTSYGSTYEGVGASVGGFLDGIDGVFGGSVGSFLKRAVRDAMATLGLQPADMRLRKPVLTNTQDVLAQAGYEREGKIRQLLQAFPDSGEPLDIARALGLWIWDEVRDGHVVVAELPVPGTNDTIPLDVDLAVMGGAA